MVAEPHAMALIMRFHRKALKHLIQTGPLPLPSCDVAVPDTFHYKPPLPSRDAI